MLNPSHLDLFDAVVRHGGITKAAIALGIGQPHVSRAIAKLEADLGFLLFVRGRGSASLTHEGEAFAQEVQRTYAGLDHLCQAARQIRELGTGPLRIACQPSLASRLLPRAIRILKGEFPGARIAVHVPTPDLIWSWVDSGQCDIGLVRPRAGYTGVIRESFLTIEAVCAVHKQHPLANRKFITAADLKYETLIAGAPGEFQQTVEDVFAREGIVPEFSLTAQYTAARCGLVSEGLGLAIVDPLPAHELSFNNILLKPFTPAVLIETTLIRRASAPRSLAERLIAILKFERDSISLGMSDSVS